MNIALVETIRKDIQDHKNKLIEKLPTNKEYAEKFCINEKTVSREIGVGLTVEEIRYRMSEIASYCGKVGGKKNMKFYGRHLTKEERRINNMKADAVEELVKEYMEEEGYKVVYVLNKVKQEDGSFRSTLNSEEIEQLENGKKIMEDILSLYQEGLKVRPPDLICQKKDEIIFMDVKSYDAKIERVRQKTTLQALGHKGYRCMVFKVPVSREDFMNSINNGVEVTLNPSIIEFFPEKED